MAAPVLTIARDYRAKVDARWFDAAYWRESQALTGSSVGRGGTWFFRSADTEFVLRTYRRGGLLGRLIEARYIFTGYSRTRAAQEFALLTEMRGEGMPVPTPVAALVQRKHVFFYRAQLITEKIQSAQDLALQLAEQTLSSDQWREIGATVERFHRSGICHSDLNLRNVLIDVNGQVWLIDFDKCQRKSSQAKWCDDNLQRFKRSLNKEKALNASLQWESADWQYFLQGYEGVS